ncbi:sulfurtransferase complex subunit TusD [Proteobacteria bacterium 005FR1]|nr:sulfurtransferase complex subunit TusD [Proteobacteria bacterium 005FR1]
MKFSLAIYAGPSTPELCSTALQFAEALLAKGHSIYRLFFFSDGVLNAVPGPGAPLFERWQHLILDNQLDAVVCVTSAKHRGIEARPGEAGSSLRLGEGFVIGGLGQLIDATVHSDRLVTFGS